MDNLPLLLTSDYLTFVSKIYRYLDILCIVAIWTQCRAVVMFALPTTSFYAVVSWFFLLCIKLCLLV